MSSGYQLKDLTDLVDAVARELKIQDTDTVERERIKEDLNDVYVNEVAAKKRWPWLQGHVDVQHKPYYGSGTVTVTPDSTTITFSVAPASSLGSFAGKFFAADNFNEVYIIDTHTAASTTAVLKSAYTGALNTTAAFKVWTDQVVLPTDCRETVEVWHDHFNQPLEALGHQELRKRQTESPKAQGRPVYYNTYDFVDPTPLTDETEADRYRVLKLYPAIYSDSTTIHIDYVKEVTHLSEDGDEPLMPMEDRMVLVYGGRQLAWLRQRNPEASEMNRVRFEAKLAQMMGKVEEGVDKPQLTPDSLYISRKRGPKLKSLRGANASNGSGGSYTAPTYLSGATINGANLTAALTANAGITIDGRDVSADGTAQDSHIAATSGVHGATGSVVGTTDTQTLTNKTIAAGSNTITGIANTNIDVAAAISYSKLNLTGNIVNADVSSSAAIARSKVATGSTNRLVVNDGSTGALSDAAAITASRALVSDTNGIPTHSATTSTEVGYVSGVTSAIQTQLNTKITASSTDTLTNKSIDADTNTITNIENADIKAAAAIALNKLAATTASRALVSDGSGFVSASAVTATELGYVSGATSNLQTQISAISLPSSSIELTNLGVAATVAASALTIALTDSAGATPSASSPVKIGFRNVATSPGVYNQRSVTAALSTVISSGSTAGHASGSDHYLYVYALDNAGTVELAWSSALFDEGTIQTTTAEGGAGAADSGSTLYSTTARANVPIRLIGRIKTNQATAGTWATTPAQVSLANFQIRAVAFRARSSTTSTTSGTEATVIFPTKSYDYQNMYDASTGIATVPEDGIYAVAARGQFASNAVAAAGRVFTINTAINGTGATAGDVYSTADQAYATTAREYQTALCGLLELIKGDSVRIRANQNSGNTVALAGGGSENYFAMVKIGDFK